MQFPFERDVTSLEALKEVAVELAGDCGDTACITLQGTLGAGKTTFAQYFIRHLAGEGTEVVSPTFLLVQEYDVTLQSGMKSPVFHLDLYRLKDASELQELGLEDMLQEGITLIEWPEIAVSLLPETRIALHFEERSGIRYLRGENHG